MKLSLLFLIPFFAVSCAGSNPEPEKDPSTENGETEEVETPPEEPEEPEEDPLEFVTPNTTGELMKEEDKKTVSGPVPVTVPEPPADSVIDVPPPVPTEE